MRAEIDYAHLHLTESLWGRDGLRKGYCTCGWTTPLTDGDVVRTLIEIHLREAKELKAKNGGKGYKLKTFTIESKDKKDYFICTVEPEQIKLEDEIYGNGPGSADVETFYTIAQGEYAKIAAKFGKIIDDEIADVLKYIEECDRIAEFKKDIVDGVIEVSDKSSWWHFDDDDEDDLPPDPEEIVYSEEETKMGKQVKEPHVKLTDRFFEAVAYASDAHKSQVRKSTDIAYISHPLGVAALVLEAGGDEDQAIAALLHDVAEDCGGEPRLVEIAAKFGDRVAKIVRGCSDSLVEDDTQKAPWRQRKESHIAHLAGADMDVLIVTAADKTHNARAIATDIQEIGNEVWKRFNASKEEILWYYNSMYIELAKRSVTPKLLHPLRAAIAIMCADGFEHFMIVEGEDGQ